MSGLGHGIIALLVIGGLAFFAAPLWAWCLAILFGLISLYITHYVTAGIFYTAFILLLAGMSVLYITRFRHRFIIEPLFRSLRKNMPRISSTERDAIDAGEVWWEGELFRGNPHWEKLFNNPKPILSQEEVEFINTQVDALCAQLDDWTITHKALDLSKETWNYIKKEKFFGMLIPKQYGGLEFSALAQSTIIQKLATRSLTAAVTVMVPNSLGPAELLIHYGTEEQKNYYLPKLATGEEIPCFALTGPEAGSDAGSIPDTGIVCQGKFEGKEIIGLRLTWDKRYITLAPIATVLGLAIKLFDPEGLLGSKKELGITLVLLPTRTPGVSIGKRHFPLDQSFLNGPTRGQEVFVPLDWIIGGPSQAGKGWRMLVECLSAGRGISLPALSSGAAKHCYRTTGAYAKIRKQFKTSIGQFEGVQAALARIAGHTYLMESMRLLTLSAIDQNIKPAITTAMTKYHMTEFSRQIANDAMDVQGGKGIMLGPHNYLGRCYQSMPISITVEGANILTRSLMIFGQGAIRCHPFLRQEIQVLNSVTKDENTLATFDKLFSRHLQYSLSNFARLVFHSLTGGWFAASYASLKPFKKIMRELSRRSIALAVVSDVTLLLLGGHLKRSERESARLGDVLSYLYMASSVLKYYHDVAVDTFAGASKKQADFSYAQWALQTCLYRLQEAFLDFFQNFPVKSVGYILRLLVFPLGRTYQKPSDALEHQLAQFMLMPNEFRDRLTQYCYQGQANDASFQLERALREMMMTESILSKIEAAEKKGLLSRIMKRDEKLRDALDLKIVTKEEIETLNRFEKLRREVIAVDEFSDAELRNEV